MLEQLMTRRKLILLASVPPFFPAVLCSPLIVIAISVSYDNSEGSKVLRTAMSQYGAKYKYGKASPSDGFDCSGLIFWLTANTELPFPATPPLNQKPANGWLPARPAGRYCCFQDRPTTPHRLGR